MPAVAPVGAVRWILRRAVAGRTAELNEAIRFAQHGTIALNANAGLRQYGVQTRRVQTVRKPRAAHVGRRASQGASRSSKPTATDSSPAPAGAPAARSPPFDTGHRPRADENDIASQASGRCRRWEAWRGRARRRARAARAAVAARASSPVADRRPCTRSRVAPGTPRVQIAAAAAQVDNVAAVRHEGRDDPVAFVVGAAVPEPHHAAVDPWGPVQWRGEGQGSRDSGARSALAALRVMYQEFKRVLLKQARCATSTARRPSHPLAIDVFLPSMAAWNSSNSFTKLCKTIHR